MFNRPKAIEVRIGRGQLVFWFTVGLLVATLFQPETVIKVAAVGWMVMVVGWVGFKLFFNWCWKRGAVTLYLTEPNTLSAHDINSLSNARESLRETHSAEEVDKIMGPQCNHRAHSIHCDTMSSRPDRSCDCVPSHPVNCGVCGSR